VQAGIARGCGQQVFPETSCCRCCYLWGSDPRAKLAVDQLMMMMILMVVMVVMAT
jgi:hypothetical protein